MQSSGGTGPGGSQPPPGGWQSTPQPPPPPPSTPDWQSSPQPPSPPPSGGGGAGSNWTANLTSREAVPGPAGLFYADVPNRIIAYIIDAIILAVVGFVLSIIVSQVISPITIAPGQGFFGIAPNPVYYIVMAVLQAAVSAAYFIFMWSTRRMTVGMMALGLQVGNESDGATLTTNQAATRWALLGGPPAIAQALFGFGIIGLLLFLVGIGWLIYLLVTTAQSPTKQGFHDRYAKSIMVKAGNRMF